MTCKYFLLIRIYELLIRKYELVIRKYELVKIFACHKWASVSTSKEGFEYISADVFERLEDCIIENYCNQFRINNIAPVLVLTILKSS